MKKIEKSSKEKNVLVSINCDLYYFVGHHRHSFEKIFGLFRFISFEADTCYQDIVRFKKQIQDEFDRQIEHCVVNIIIADN